MVRMRRRPHLGSRPRGGARASLRRLPVACSTRCSAELYFLAAARSGSPIHFGKCLGPRVMSRDLPFGRRPGFFCLLHSSSDLIRIYLPPFGQITGIIRFPSYPAAAAVLFGHAFAALSRWTLSAALFSRSRSSFRRCRSAAIIWSTCSPALPLPSRRSRLSADARRTRS